MNYRYRLVVLFLCLGGLVAVFRLSEANGQGRPPGTFLESLSFVEQKGSIPVGKDYRYANTILTTNYDGTGRCSYSAYFLGQKYGMSLGAGCHFQTGDVVGMLGGVFRAKFDYWGAVLDRIPDKDLPKGAKLPEWDSLTVPLQGAGGFGLGRYVVSLKVLEIGVKPQTDVTASLEITIGFNQKKSATKKNIVLSAKVKAGDVLLLWDKGHQVRAIVPPDRKTRVVGWVELSPDPIPEADLIRDKIAFVRPEPRNEKPK
ncbi:MAG: hypothetical protein EXS16_06385 [Gemmataceae bacterium]|nr:hypothetical protein [Gemmataceae bacterium]